MIRIMFPYVMGCISSLILGFVLCIHVYEDSQIPTIGTSVNFLKELKEDCEKSLPRDQECVLVYDYVPAKRAEK